MTTATLPNAPPRALPYASPRTVDIPNLDPFFGPDAPMLPDPEPMPDGMQQNPYILHVMQILIDVLADRPNVFVDMNTIVYYDPTNGNRRFQPDVYVAFDVDKDAIRERNGYVIWEAGKPPDFAMEVASESTARHDIGRKRDLYARLGIREYWRFDASGDYYGHRLAGEYLDRSGVYQPFPIHNAGNNLLWGYSPLLRLNLRWDDGWLDLQDPDTGAILLDRRGVRLEWEAAERERDAAVQEREAAQRGQYTAQRRQYIAQHERDAAQQERDAAQHERDAAQQERDTAQQELDAAQQERDAAQQERDAAQQELDAAQQERDAARQAQRSAQQERDAAISAMADYQERVRRLKEQLRGRE